MTTTDNVEVKEKPILFSGPMVRAILEGRKSQTRRAIRNKEEGERFLDCNQFGDAIFTKQGRDYRNVYNGYGLTGDRLWVRETWAPHDDGALSYQEREYIYYRADDQTKYETDGAWRPSIFMPRWASRITLEITTVRVERLQEITAADAKAEGIEPFLNRDATAWRAGFQIGWDSINGKRKGCTWADNPLVWIIEFRRL